MTAVDFSHLLAPQAIPRMRDHPLWGLFG